MCMKPEKKWRYFIFSKQFSSSNKSTWKVFAFLVVWEKKIEEKHRKIWNDYLFIWHQISLSFLQRLTNSEEKERESEWEVHFRGTSSRRQLKALLQSWGLTNFHLYLLTWVPFWHTSYFEGYEGIQYSFAIQKKSFCCFCDMGQF